MTTPRLSVILPSHNHERFVERALRSVLAQDHPDLELVVVDDGSTDGSREVIRRVLQDAGAVRVVYHEQPNSGAHAALTRGIELSSGGVIALLNSDDAYDRARFASLRPWLGSDGDFLLFSGLTLIGPDDEEVAPRTDVAHWYHTALRQSSQCPTVGFALLCNNLAVTSGNLVFSRGLYERVGGFRPYRYCHDWDFLLRSLRHVEPIFVPQSLHGYRLHESNTIGAADVSSVDEEYGRILTGYLEDCADGAPANPLAPCAANWPLYFPYFARTHTRFNSRRIADLVADARLVELPAADRGWGSWTGGVLELARREDAGLLRAGSPDGSPAAGHPLERQVLLRELALVRLGLHERYPELAPPGLTDLELARAWNERVRAAADGARRPPR